MEGSIGTSNLSKPSGLERTDDYADESESELRRAYREGRVVITPIVYAELAADFVIGAHATVDADGLISFASAFYEAYYPSVTVYPE